MTFAISSKSFFNADPRRKAKMIGSIIFSIVISKIAKLIVAHSLHPSYNLFYWWSVGEVIFLALFQQQQALLLLNDEIPLSCHRAYHLFLLLIILLLLYFAQDHHEIVFHDKKQILLIQSKLSS